MKLSPLKHFNRFTFYPDRRLKDDQAEPDVPPEDFEW